MTCSAHWPPANAPIRWWWSAATRSAAVGPRHTGAAGTRALRRAAAWPRPSCTAPPRYPRKYGVPLKNAGPAYADMATLRGDSSDGLPGVAGIGDKSASLLISRFGSLDALTAAVGRSGRGSVPGHAGQTPGRRDLSEGRRPGHRVVCDADVDLSRPDILPSAPADPDRLRELATIYNAESPITRLITALSVPRSA